jgi:hypothetical protein
MKSPKIKNFIYVVLASLVLNIFMVSEVSAAVAATLALSPNSSNVGVGQTFDVAIVLNTGGSHTSGTDISLRFDKDKLNIVDIKNGTIYDQYVGKNINNTTGVATISGLASSADSLFTGTGTFATITFRAIAPGTAAVTFAHTPGNKNDTNVADFDTQGEALATVTNGSYVISGTGSGSTSGSTGSTTTTTTTRLPVTSSALPLVILSLTSIALVVGGFMLYRSLKKDHTPLPPQVQ